MQPLRDSDERGPPATRQGPRVDEAGEIKRVAKFVKSPFAGDPVGAVSSSEKNSR